MRRYEERIWDTYAKFEVLESTLARFQAKALQVGQWIDKQVAKFNRCRPAPLLVRALAAAAR